MIYIFSQYIHEAIDKEILKVTLNLLTAGAGTHEAFTQVGLCVLAGIFVFIIVEMMATHETPAPNHNNNTKGTSTSETTRKEVSCG